MADHRSDSRGRITLWAIEIFLATADEASISAAARRLGASVSSISQQLSNLEAAVGTTLIDRSVRPMVLTPAGELFRRRAQSIVNEAEMARAELAMQDMSRLERLRLGMIEDFDADVTPALLVQMAEDLAETRFLLETGASHRLHDQLDAQALDMIVAAEIGPPADWMEVHPLLEERFVAAVPRGRIDRSGDVLAQLRAMPLIRYTSRHHMGRQIARHLERQQLKLDYRFELDSYHAIMALVAAGAGWTILTPLGFLRAHRFCEAAELVELPIAPFSRRIVLSARRDRLGVMPADMAARLKLLLDEMIVRPVTARSPWLASTLTLL